MSLRRIRELLARIEQTHTSPTIVELKAEVGAMIAELDMRIHDLQSVLGSADLGIGPHASTLELMVRGLAEEFSQEDHNTLARSREGDPILPWRELASMLVDGSDARQLPDWVLPAFRQVTSILRNEEFPCIFARQANNLKSGWLCYVDSVATDAGRETVRLAIDAYFTLLKRHPRERTIIMPLMVIVKPCYPMHSLAEYRDQAWGLFNYLHAHDPEPWPIDVPMNPDRGDWSFCYSGIQLFSNVSDPAHKIHKSRNLGDSLIFAMQPRTNFDLVGGNNRKGRMVRDEIRSRAARYENRPPASHLGFYGTPDNREWLQMATKDSEADVEFPAVCPFMAKLKKDE